MVIEYARSVAGLETAASTEFDPDCPEQVIATMEEQKSFVEGAGDLGGTMRLGLYPADLKHGTVVRDQFGKDTGNRRPVGGRLAAPIVEVELDRFGRVIGRTK
jgi:CTP synthase